MITETIKSSIRYWTTVRFLKLVCRYYKIDLEHTNVWRELHTAYNPIVAIDIPELFFEDSYLRTKWWDFKRRNKRLFFYMHRVEDFDPYKYIALFMDLTPRQQKRLRWRMGIETHMGMMFFTAGYWKNDSEKEKFVYRG